MSFLSLQKLRYIFPDQFSYIIDNHQYFPTKSYDFHNPNIREVSVELPKQIIYEKSKKELHIK